MTHRGLCCEAQTNPGGTTGPLVLANNQTGGFCSLWGETQMHLDFMTPDVWNGLVLGVVVIGLALAVLRLYSDYARRDITRDRQTQQQHTSPHDDSHRDT